MPNHAHMLLTPFAGQELSAILHSLKSYTANEANKLAGRSGQFWQPESFDRWVRDANHFANVIAYIENNPVKAHLCEKPEDWPFSSAWFRKKGLR
jgi:putative transposase